MDRSSTNAKICRKSCVVIFFLWGPFVNFVVWSSSNLVEVCLILIDKYIFFRFSISAVFQKYWVFSRKLEWNGVGPAMHPVGTLTLNFCRLLPLEVLDIPLPQQTFQLLLFPLHGRSFLREPGLISLFTDRSSPHFPSWCPLPSDTPLQNFSDIGS